MVRAQGASSSTRDARLAAEKAAQYATANAELEARVRVLEQIVTDGGIETAAQIEALRDTPRLTRAEKDLVMNPFEMVVLIVVIVMVGEHLASARHRAHGAAASKWPRKIAARSLRLREEVDQLKDRIKVLERIAVEKENSLSREIEDLRDR